MKNDLTKLFLNADSYLAILKKEMEQLATHDPNTQPPRRQINPFLIINTAVAGFTLSAPGFLSTFSYACEGHDVFLHQNSAQYLKSAYLKSSDTDSFAESFGVAYYNMLEFFMFMLGLHLAVYFFINTNEKKIDADIASIAKINQSFNDLMQEIRMLSTNAQTKELLSVEKLLRRNDLPLLRAYGKYGKHYEFALTALQAIYINCAVHSQTKLAAEYSFTEYATSESFFINQDDKMLLCLARQKMQDCINLIIENNLKADLPKYRARDVMVYTISRYIIEHLYLWKKHAVFVDNMDLVIAQLPRTQQKMPAHLLEQISLVDKSGIQPLSTIIATLDRLRQDDDFARLSFLDGKNWLHQLPTLDGDPDLAHDLAATSSRLIHLGLDPYKVDVNNRTAFAFIPKNSSVNYDQKYRPGIAPGFIGVESRINVIDDAFQAVKQSADGAPHFILLSGPPGVGKTELTQIIAAHNGFVVKEFSRGEREDKWLSQLEARINEYFTEAEKSTTPVCLFVDEIDTVCPELEGNPQNGSFNHDKINTLFQTKIDKIKGKVILVAATNFPDKIKDAVRNRVALEILFHLPNVAEREQALMETLRAYPVSDRKIFAQLAVATSSWSPRQLISFAKQAIYAANKQKQPVIQSSALVFQFEVERGKIKRTCFENYRMEIEPQKLDLESTQKYNGVAIAPNILNKFNSIANHLVNPGIYQRIVNPGVLVKARHLLLSGPPGTGKSTIAKDLAANVNVVFFKLAGGRYKTFDKIHELSRIFEYIKRAERAIVFIDEIDAMTKQLSPARELLQMFITENEDRFIFIGATNYNNTIDDAILSRFELVEFSLPNYKERKTVFEYYNRNIRPDRFSPKLSENLNSLHSFLAVKARGLSQRDIEKIVSNAIHALADKSITDPTATLEPEDFKEILQKFQSKHKLVRS